MLESHPTREDLEGFMLGELGAEESRRVLRHLVSDCAHCKTATSTLWQAGEGLPAEAEDGVSVSPAVAALGAQVGRAGNDAESGYDSALDRVFDHVRQVNAGLQCERAEAQRLLAELTRHPLERQRILIQNSARYQSWGLCELVLSLPQEALSDPREWIDAAELSIAVAESLNPAAYGFELVEDLRARAWAHLANARRSLSDARGAEQAFHVAESHLARGTGDRLERARLLEQKASLRNLQGRQGEAIRLLNRAIAIYQKMEQPHLLGRALLNKGHVTAYTEDKEMAIALLGQGLELVDADREPRLVAMGYHNLAYVLNEMGQNREALPLLARARLLYLESGDRLCLTRLQYLEARIALGLGRVEQAEGLLREVRKSFVEKGMAHDAALASLDLAQLYAQQGRLAEVQSLGKEMLPIFQSRELHREALAALIVFQQAAEAETATAALIQKIAGRLHNVRRDSAGAAF
ncbi:MAG TPA: hypothetical protein VOA87_17150 [Thermoanaerobaculia bacterium]|nr:hypothetical protein [Thermoanaerobaculia bacterium]